MTDSVADGSRHRHGPLGRRWRERPAEDEWCCDGLRQCSPFRETAKQWNTARRPGQVGPFGLRKFSGTEPSSSARWPNFVLYADWTVSFVLFLCFPVFLFSPSWPNKILTKLGQSSSQVNELVPLSSVKSDFSLCNLLLVKLRLASIKRYQQKMQKTQGMVHAGLTGFYSTSIPSWSL